MAIGHGPCRCTTPRTGPPDTEILFDTRTLEAVLNPPPDELRIDAPPAIYGYYVADAPTKQLVSNSRPFTPERASIPDFPPGRYLAVIYDGSEGGAHYTWDYITVTAADARGETAVDDAGWILAAAAAALLFAISAAIYLRRR